MAIDFNTISDRVFDQLKGFGHSIIIYDDENKRTLDAAKGRTFYSKDQKFTVIVDEASGSIKIKYGENTDQNQLNQLVDSIKNGIAKKYLLGVDRMPYTGKEIELKDLQTANPAAVVESLGPAAGSVKTSYQETSGAKLIIRHNKPVNEEIRGSRSRNISALFIENSQGERFKYPFNHLLAARTMTQHVAHGGNPYDDVGQKIVGLSEERNQLLKVSHYIKGQGLQEQAGDINEAVRARLSEIKSILARYNPERLAADVHEASEDDLDQLKEKLTKNVFDEEISPVLPKLNGYVREYLQRQQAQQDLSELSQQVQESKYIAVTAVPDLTMASLIIYESPTVNTTELINLVLPVLEDQTTKEKLSKIGEHVSQGLVDSQVVENLVRDMVMKSQLVKEQSATVPSVETVLESAFSKFSVEEILK